MNNLLKTEYDIISNQIKQLEDLKDKKILITGASGLIGSYLTNYLIYLNKNFNYNIKIFTTSRNKEKLLKKFSPEDIFIFEQDLNKDLNFNENFDYIIHAASNAHPLAYSKNPVETMKTNILGTINLLEMIKNTSCKFIYISSGEIYGNNQDEIAFKENDLGLIDTKEFRSCYPESKRAAETLCMAYSKQYEIFTNIIRLCYVYGPTINDENSRADAQFLRNALNKENIVLKSEGLQKRTYCYVSDVISAILYILLNGKNTEVYNVANPNSIITIKEYAKTLSEIADVELKFEIPNEIEKQGYSKAQNSILSAEKLINLGWKPKFNLKEGLKHCYKIKKCLN